MAKRADSGTWTAVTGIIDPGEQPADAAAREVLEETGIVAVPERLAMVHVTDPVVYDNGDQTQYLDLVLRFAWQSGVPCPADGENTAADWFPLDDLPPMSDDMYKRIAVAVSDEPAAQYIFSPQSTGDACGARHPGTGVDSLTSQCEGRP
ncbi:NUDIX domain-containing protein [Streptomyces microflavus]|uniref:NUDIX domain-containing protein n=1 Tax=Streptomyces microflavus TaxID=1919 RepID=UPI0037FDDDEF